MKYILLFIIASMGCISQPYFRSTDFIFKVDYTNAVGAPKIELLSVENRRANNLDSVEWVYHEYNLIFYQPRYCVQDSAGVMVTSPNRGVFAETEYIPNPQVKFPITIGDSIYVEQPLSNGKMMKGYLKVIEELEYGRYLNEITYAWKIEAYNLEDPKYSAIYKYNERNGIVFLKYKLNEKEIEMNLSLTRGNGFADQKEE
ncbi:MAG: hypothetical protein WC121_06860 [Candidatus Kapaibacterium sp.]